LSLFNASGDVVALAGLRGDDFAGGAFGAGSGALAAALGAAGFAKEPRAGTAGFFASPIDGLAGGAAAAAGAGTGAAAAGADFGGTVGEDFGGDDGGGGALSVEETSLAASIADGAASAADVVSIGAGGSLPSNASPTPATLDTWMTWPHLRHFMRTERPATFSSAIWYFALQLGQRNFIQLSAA